MKMKSTVDVFGMRPELLLAVVIADGIHDKLGYDCILTSARDGKHSLTSLHYAGAAVDLRTKHLSGNDALVVTEQIRDALTEDYDVLLEMDHIHIEYQPRR